MRTNEKEAVMHQFVNMMVLAPENRIEMLGYVTKYKRLLGVSKEEFENAIDMDDEESCQIISKMNEQERLFFLYLATDIRVSNPNKELEKYLTKLMNRFS